jgi:hypothetical protein
VVGTATVDFRRRNDMEWNRHDHNDQETIHQDVHQWNRTSIVLEEQEERKRLQEERRRIQEAHKLLAEEKEKLARDRQQLEVYTRRHQQMPLSFHNFVIKFYRSN